jgi:hypothetical protein
MTGPRTTSMSISAEKLTYWYLRLNGFLTIQNFIVHPDTGSEQRTDADILGVRFPYRAELWPHPMVDDIRFSAIADRPYIILAEVKRMECQLNGPWTAQERENIQRVLRAVGRFREKQTQTVANALYKTGVYDGRATYLSLACFGATRNAEIAGQFPNVPQILWPDVLGFIHSRFRSYRDQKSSHGQWDRDGKALWDYVWRHRDVDAFRAHVTILA